MTNIEKESLLGLTIGDATNKIGRWWMCVSCQVNWPYGWYRFQNMNKYIELRTDSKNIVTSVKYN